MLLPLPGLPAHGLEALLLLLCHDIIRDGFAVARAGMRDLWRNARTHTRQHVAGARRDGAPSREPPRRD